MKGMLDALDNGDDVQVAVSAVNWCEILTRLYRDNRAMTVGELAALLAGIEVVMFTDTDAELAAAFALADPSLSLGDRACLALASDRKATAWTTDKLWARFKIPVQIEILR